MSDRLKRFEAWVATQDVDVRKGDLSRIAAELDALCGSTDLDQSHVDALVKRYKQGLAGAQRILAAQRVGDLMIRFHGEGEPPPAAFSAPPAAAAPRAASAPRHAAMSEEARAFAFEADLAEPEPRGPKSVIPGPKVSTWARQPGSEAPPPLFEHHPTDDAWTGAAAREQSFPEIEGVENLPRFDAAPIDHEAPSSRRSDRPSQLPAVLGHVMPKGLAGPTPQPKLGPLDAALDVETGSVRPRPRGSDAPAPYQAETSPASTRPGPISSRPPPRDEPPLSGGLSGVGLMVSPIAIVPRERVPLPPPPTAYPVGAVAAAVLTPDKRVDGSGARLWGGLGFSLLVGIAVIVIITKPSCMFADPGKPVQGLFVVKHLGLRMTFPERWLHGEDLDDKEKTPQGYTRKISVFYQGTSATDYAAKLEVITLQKEGETPSEDIARNNGAGETLDQARNVNCNPIVRGTVRGTRCTSFSQQLGSPAPYATVEFYFPLGSFTLFARGRVKIPSMLSGGGHSPPGLGGPMGQQSIPTENREVMDRLDQIEDIIDTIDVAR